MCNARSRHIGSSSKPDDITSAASQRLRRPIAALAGFCITGDTASGDPNVGGLITLNSVAAAVLGGAALSGGVGTLFGSVLGSLVIGLVGSLVFFLGTPSEWQNLVQGLTVLAALMVGILFGGKARA